MMKMDDRDSAEHQILENRDIMGIIEFDFKSLKNKIENSPTSPT